jgi:hypothetical protein
MTLLLLEALGAGLLFIGIIWWTMFAGRENGELPGPDPTATPPTAVAQDNTAEPVGAANSQPAQPAP